MTGDREVSGTSNMTGMREALERATCFIRHIASLSENSRDIVRECDAALSTKQEGEEASRPWCLDTCAAIVEVASIKAEAMRSQALEEAARIAENGCLVPPDGGSPTEDERLMCESIAAQIRALSLPAPDAATMEWASKAAAEVKAAGPQPTRPVSEFIAEQRTGWRDIETAPKNGTPVLLHCQHGHAIGYAFELVVGWYSEETDDLLMPDPVGWMPLPRLSLPRQRERKGA